MGVCDLALRSRGLVDVAIRSRAEEMSLHTVTSLLVRVPKYDSYFSKTYRPLFRDPKLIAFDVTPNSQFLASAMLLFLSVRNREVLF
jgi:hypothetical protein